MKIYISSSIRHRHKWRALRAEGVPVSCSWIDEDPKNRDLVGAWEQRLKEVSEADVLIFFANQIQDTLVELVEVGVAIGHGVPVMWVYFFTPAKPHHLITLCSSINEALDKAMEIPSRAP